MKFLTCTLVAVTLLASSAFAASGTIAKHHKKHKPAHSTHHKKPAVAPTAPATEPASQAQAPKITL